MVKILEDAGSLQIKKQFDEFVQQINPKPSAEEIETLKQECIDRRVSVSISD